MWAKNIANTSPTPAPKYSSSIDSHHGKEDRKARARPSIPWSLAVSSSSSPVTAEIGTTPVTGSSAGIWQSSFVGSLPEPCSGRIVAYPEVPRSNSCRLSAPVPESLIAAFLTHRASGVLGLPDLRPGKAKRGGRSETGTDFVARKRCLPHRRGCVELPSLGAQWSLEAQTEERGKGTKEGRRDEGRNPCPPPAKDPAFQEEVFNVSETK